MRPAVHTAFGLVIAGAVALPAAASPADRVPASAGGDAANSVTFTDPAGDVPAGRMDITTVTVSNDDAGKITFQIHIPTHATPLPNRSFQLHFDIDRNPTTGDEVGNDFSLYATWPDPTVYLLRNTGRSGTPVPGSPVAGRYAGNVKTVEIDGAAFGSLPSGGAVESFDFSIFIIDFSVNLEDDLVPGPGFREHWTYEMIATAPPATPATPNRVAITSLTRQPQVPVAGKPFKVAVAVRRVGRAGQFRGDVSCSANIAGKRLRGAGLPGAGRASCSWRIPANAAGKTITGSIGVSEEGGPAVTRRFSAKIVRPR